MIDKGVQRTAPLGQGDSETDLHYNRFRYYDADIGRYASVDPIGLAGGTNSYQYAPNASGWTDPLGLAKASCSCYGPNVALVAGDKLSPSNFGKVTIAEDPVLLEHWNDAMRSAANSSRSNGYKRYLESLGKGETLTQKMLEEAFGAVNSRFLPAARTSGFDFAEVHHWNFGKTDFPQGIVDSRGLVPVESRVLHQEIHAATSSSSNIWGGTISPQHQIMLDDWLTKLPPWE